MSTKKKNDALDFLDSLLGPVSFGELLVSIRTTEDVSQTAFAKRLRISKQELCNIEKQKKWVSLERAVTFAKRLGWPPKVFAKYVLQDQLSRAGLKGEISIEDVA
ncbi:MAG: hypothetical protein ACLGG7_05000 [Bacteriovoracia bacterium]